MKKLVLLVICLFCLYKINAQICTLNITPISGTYTVCNGSSATFLANGSGGGNYVWAVDSVWSSSTNGGSGGYVWTSPLVVGTSSVVTLSPNITTKYLVTDTGGGCYVTQTFVVYVNPKPVVSIGGSPVLCTGTGAQLIATGAQSYTWSPNPNQVTTHGDTAVFYPPYPAPPSTGYTVVASDSNGCSNSATTTLNTDHGPIISHIDFWACANVGHSYVLLYGANSYTCESCVWNPTTVLHGDTMVNNLNVSQTYTLWCTDANGCGINYVGAIMVNPEPVFTVTGDTVCSGQNINLTASDSTLHYVWTNSANSYTSNVQNPTIYAATPAMAGNYIVTGNNTHLCFKTDTVSVVVNPPVTVTYTLTKDNSIPNTWDVYPSYSSWVTSATWYWGDGTSTTGLYPTHVYAAAGTYNIMVTVFSSCGDSASYFQNASIYRQANNTMGNNAVYINVKHDATNGIATLTNNNTISIYPNPATDNFTLTLNANTPNTHILIYNALGQLVINQPVNELNTNVGLNFAAGVYQALVVSQGKTIYQTKLIKQ